jgi:hypothetical protein
VRADALWQRRPRAVAALAAVLVLLTLPLVPIGLPVLPARAAIDAGMVSARKDYADMLGWQELAASVARVYRSLPPAERRHATIWANNDGEAGAVDLYGPEYGLPHAISTHLTYYYWKPSHTDDRTVIVVGLQRGLLSTLFGDIRQVATIRNTYDVDNEENGRPIYLCRRPKRSLDQAWPSLQSWD